VPSATATSKPVDSEQSDSEVVEIEQPRSTFRDAYKGLAMVKSFARTDSELSALLYEVEEKLLKLRFTSQTQTDIRKFLTVGSDGKALEATPLIATASNENEKTGMSELCCVCGHECDGAHYCLLCHRRVHAICGDHDPEAEGYGQPITCRTCVELLKRKEVQ
jgi:hypothetical protein